MLAIRKADGKRYWLSADFHVVPQDRHKTLVPKGRYCQVGRSDLIAPSMLECLPPESAPATSLARSKSSALRKDRKRPPLISGISASYGTKTKVLWTKTMAELLDGPAKKVMILGHQQLDPHRVLLMVRTERVHLHLIFINPTDGSILEREVLFADSAPGH